jgi:DNA-binding LytR/AlgR family response regulator
MRVLIIADDEFSSAQLQRHVLQTGELDLVTVRPTARAAVEALGNRDVDLVLMDAPATPAALAELRLLGKRPAVVLVSEHSEHSVEASDIDIVDYLVKPVPYSRFLKALERVQRRLNGGGTAPERSIFLRIDGQLTRVALPDIYWVEWEGETVKVHTSASVYVLPGTMQSMEQLLPENEFLRVHRSHLVRLDRIARVEADHVILPRERVPIGPSYRQAVLNRLQRR